MVIREKHVSATVANHILKYENRTETESNTSVWFSFWFSVFFGVGKGGVNNGVTMQVETNVNLFKAFAKFDIVNEKQNLVVTLISIAATYQLQPLFHFLFSEKNMAIYTRIVLAELEFLSHFLSTFPLNVEETSSSSRDKTNEHESLLLFVTHFWTYMR